MLMFYLAMLDTPEQKSKFQMIYENYTGQILQTAHSLARNHMDAEDIAQDVFLKIINNIDTIQTENPLRLRALIIQMTKFASIDLLRKKKHKENPNDLINSNTLFVSESFARRFLGDADPIGKVLMLERKTEMIVRGVYRDIPENTMFKADFVVSVHKEGGYKDGAGWGGNDIFYAVFRTGEASDIEVVNDNIQRMVEKYMPTEHNGWKLELSVIPLATKHQTSSETTKRLVIYGFLGFSIFFVAIMNYMLIVIATLGRRAKSVGVHKCNGANNGNIL